MDLETLEFKIARSENLPVLPQIASQVLKLADDPNASPKMVERLVERDPAITAKILRVANSAYYGLNQVPSISRAISVLGLNTIRSLIVGVAYQQVLSGQTSSTKFDKLSFWRHSLAVATGTRILAKIRMPIKAEELYGAGMMHDVGILVLDRFCPEQLDRAVTMAEDERLPLFKAEQAVLGFDHSQVGTLLADKWGLSGMMKNAIRFHHDASQDDQHNGTTSFICAADALAHMCGFDNNSPEGTVEMTEAVQEAVGIPEEQYVIIREVMIQEIARAEEAFSIKPQAA